MCSKSCRYEEHVGLPPKLLRGRGGAISNPRVLGEVPGTQSPHIMHTGWRGSYPPRCSEERWVGGSTSDDWDFLQKIELANMPGGYPSGELCSFFSRKIPPNMFAAIGQSEKLKFPTAWGGGPRM